jgi:DNA-binding MarR family transcriptional regulator
MEAIRRIVRALRVAAQRTQDEAGISAAQLFVLRRLAETPATSLNDLAERTLTDRSSVADVVERLAARGLVKRAQSTVDRRRLTISLTSAGQRLLHSAPESPTAILMDALEQLSDGELTELSRSLERLTQQMGIARERSVMLFEDEGH